MKFLDSKKSLSALAILAATNTSACEESEPSGPTCSIKDEIHGEVETCLEATQDGKTINNTKADFDTLTGSPIKFEVCRKGLDGSEVAPATGTVYLEHTAQNKVGGWMWDFNSSGEGCTNVTIMPDPILTQSLEKEVATSAPPHYFFRAIGNVDHEDCADDPYSVECTYLSGKVAFDIDK